MPLGREIGLGPGHIVLDGNQAPHKGGGAPAPHFSAHVYCDQTAGWIKMPLGRKVGLGPGHIVLDGDPASPTQRGGAQPPICGPCLVAKQSPISATAEHLVYFCYVLFVRFYCINKSNMTILFWATCRGEDHVAAIDLQSPDASCGAQHNAC